MMKSCGVFLLLTWCCFDAVAQEACQFTFASGSKTGNYYKLVEAIVAEVQGKKPGCAFQNHATSGSYENARLLRERMADLALMQSDVAYLEHFEGRPFVALAAVYTEPIHVIARRELELTKLADLTTSRSAFNVAVGVPGSGTNAHALAIVDEIREERRASDAAELVQFSLPDSEAFERLRMRDVDIAFVTSAVPVATLQDLASEQVFVLLDFDGDIGTRLAKKNPFLTRTEIPFEAYGVNKRSVRTLGVKTLLVVRPDFPQELVAVLLECVYGIAARVRGEGLAQGQASAEREELPFLADLVPEIGLDAVTIPVHPAAIAFHHENSSSFFLFFATVRAYALPIIILLTPLLVFIRLSKIAYFVHQFILGRILALLLAIWLLGSAGMYLIERSSNSSFHTFGKSTIAILHYLFSGLEAKEPITLPGNILAIVILSMGVGVATLFTATLVTLLVEKALDVRRLKRKPWSYLELKGHVVIVGWSGRVERIIRQLRSSDLLRRPPIVVVSEEVAQTSITSRDILRDIWMVERRSGLRRALRKADLRTASVALVVSEATCRQQADLETTTNALAVDSIAPDVRVIVEVQRSANYEHLQFTRADEIVDSELMGERLISQCVITPGLARVYEELFTFGEGSQEIYWIPLPAYLGGNDFRSICRMLVDVEALPIGYQCWQKGITLNPEVRDVADRARTRLVAGQRDRPADHLIVLADRPDCVPRRRSRESVRKRIEGRSKMTVDVGVEDIVESRQPSRGDVLICGWNPQAEAVIEQLSEEVICQHHHFIITVIDGPDRIGQQTMEGHQYDNVKLVVGDATKRRTLQSVGIEEFQSMVILADHTDESATRYSDHRSLMIALAASSMNPDLHIVVEVVESEHREHFGGIPGIEIVSVQELSEKLLAQAVISPGVMEVFARLLTATADSNEIYIVPIPERWQGKTFHQIYQDFLDRGTPYIPLGYRTLSAETGEPVVVLNPGFESVVDRGVVKWRHQPLTTRDSLVVIAYEEPAF